MPTYGEQYRKSYSMLYAERLQANYQRAVEEWERMAASEDLRRGWIDDQIEFKRKQIAMMRKANEKGHGSAHGLMDELNAETKVASAVDQNADRKLEALEFATNKWRASRASTVDLMTVTEKMRTSMSIADNNAKIRTAIINHLETPRVQATMATLETVEQMRAAAIRFSAMLLQQTKGFFPKQALDNMVATIFGLDPDKMDANEFEAERLADIKKIVQEASRDPSRLRDVADRIAASIDTDESPSDIASQELEEVRQAEDELEALIADRAKAALAPPTEEMLSRRALELTGTPSTRRVKKAGERSAMLTTLAMRASKYLDDNDPLDDFSESGRIATQITDLIRAGTMSKKDLTKTAAQFAGRDTGLRDDIIMRVLARDLLGRRNERSQLADLPEAATEVPFQMTDLADIKVEETAPAGE